MRHLLDNLICMIFIKSKTWMDSMNSNTKHLIKTIQKVWIKLKENKMKEIIRKNFLEIKEKLLTNIKN